MAHAPPHDDCRPEASTPVGIQAELRTEVLATTADIATLGQMDAAIVGVRSW